MSKPANNKVPELRFKGFEGEWEDKTLGESGDTQSGVGFPDAEQGGKSGIPFFKVSDMSRTGNEHEMLSSNNYVTEAQLKRKKWTPISDVPAMIFAKVGAALMLNRKRIVRRPFLIDNNMMAYLFDETWDTDFGRTLFDTINLPLYAQIGALPSYNGSDIESIVVNRPANKAEQTQIGEYFREVDRLLGLQQRKHDKLVTLKKAMLQKMFPQPGTTTPEIRFKGFSGDWAERPLRRITGKVTEKNAGKAITETLTNSAEFGVISQRDYFDKDISNADNIGGYYIVEPECFVYNPRISELAPCGPVNRNKLGRTGIMSPLYTVFRTKDVDNTFLEYFFKTNLWHPFMFFNGDTGARADRFAIKDAVFMEMPVPYPDPAEQQKIGHYFRTLDALIAQHALQLQKLKQLKAACLERMFV